LKKVASVLASGSPPMDQLLPRRSAGILSIANAAEFWCKFNAEFSIERVKKNQSENSVPVMLSPKAPIIFMSYVNVVLARILMHLVKNTAVALFRGSRA